jgi:tRNA pseudouridine55 synthase
MPGFWLNIYKEKDVTSFDVVSRIRRILGIKKVGHGGTLDPFATGVLPIAVGEATKTVDYVMACKKKYAFTITFGELRDTGDTEGKTVETSEKIPTKDEIAAVLPKFIGNIEQTPPKYSAIKIDGKRAYDLAREGREFDMKSRTIQIFDLQFLDFDEAEKSANFIVECGKGTYIRSLAEDIAKVLGTVGYTSKLERLEVGNFKKEDSVTLDKLEKYKKSDELQEHIISINDSLSNLVEIKIDESEEKKIRNGVAIFINNKSQINSISEFQGKKIVKLVNSDNFVVALAEVNQNDIKPFKVFVSE